MKSSLKLQTDSILQVPLPNYANDFTFIVNNVEFRTNKFAADLLSPKISKIHQSDPTISEYHINTETKGNFQYFLDLLNFKTKEFTEENHKFISEIIEELSIDHIDINLAQKEINKENVFEMIETHSKFRHFYSKELDTDINFLSCHLYEMKEEEEENSLFKLSSDIIEKVLTNDQLCIENEDQLLRIVNKLYARDPKFARFYGFVIFKNVEREALDEFLTIFDTDHMTAGAWRSLSERLIGYENEEKEINERRYKNQSPKKKKKEEARGQDILYSSDNLKGIFAHLSEQSNIEEEVKVTTSSGLYGNRKLLLDIENTQNYFYPNNLPNSWICFEFKHHSVIPSNYTIRNYNGVCNPRSWVIEGSTTGNEWDRLSEERDCTHLRGAKLVHTFAIQNEEKKEFKFIRIKSTGPDWHNYNYLEMCSIEFYGKLI